MSASPFRVDAFFPAFAALVVAFTANFTAASSRALHAGPWPVHPSSPLLPPPQPPWTVALRATPSPRCARLRAWPARRRHSASVSSVDSIIALRPRVFAAAFHAASRGWAARPGRRPATAHRAARPRASPRSAARRQLASSLGHRHLELQGRVLRAGAGSLVNSDAKLFGAQGACSRLHAFAPAGGQRPLSRTRSEGMLVCSRRGLHHARLHPRRTRGSPARARPAGRSSTRSCSPSGATVRRRHHVVVEAAVFVVGDDEQRRLPQLVVGAQGRCRRRR